jgi:hypothetical protein
MDEHVKKELDVYEMMLKNWMNSDLAYALRIGGGNWGFLIDDLYEKFWDWMFPALRRLRESEYVTTDELKEYTSKMVQHVANFKKVLEELGKEEDNE